MNFNYSSLNYFFKFFFRVDVTIMGVLVSMLTALLRSLYLKSSCRELMLEILLCGILTITAASAIEYLNAPENIIVGIGGVIGFIGVRKTREYLIIFIQKRLSGK